MAFTLKSDDVKGLGIPGIGSMALGRRGMGSVGVSGIFGTSTPAPVGALTYLGATLKLDGSTITYNPS